MTTKKSTTLGNLRIHSIPWSPSKITGVVVIKPPQEHRNTISYHWLKGHERYLLVSTIADQRRNVLFHPQDPKLDALSFTSVIRQVFSLLFFLKKVFKGFYWHISITTIFSTTLKIYIRSYSLIHSYVVPRLEEGNDVSG